MPVNVRSLFELPQRIDELEALLRGRVRRAGDVMTGDLTVGGNLTVVGKRLEVAAVEEQSTQLVVENLGTGPAMIVRQAGAGVPVARFVDSDNDAVVVIHDAGTVGIGVEVPSVGVRLEVAGIIKAEGLQVGTISFDAASGADLPYATATVSGVVQLTTDAASAQVDARDYAVVSNAAFREWLAAAYLPHFDGGHDDRYVRLADPGTAQNIAGDLVLSSGSVSVPQGTVSAATVQAGTYLNLPVATATEPGIVQIQDGAAVAASLDALTSLTSATATADAATRDWAEARFLNAAGDALDQGATLALGGAGGLTATAEGGVLQVARVEVLGDPYADWVNLPAATADGARGTVVLAPADFLASPSAPAGDAAAPATAVAALRTELVDAAAARQAAYIDRFADVAGDTFTGDLVVAAGARLDVRGGRDAWVGLPYAGLADTEHGTVILSSAIDSSREDRAATSLAVSLVRADLEQTIAEVQELASAEYLPLAGGTLTGDLHVGAAATVTEATGAAQFSAVTVVPATGETAYTSWTGLPVAGTAGAATQGVVSLTDDPAGGAAGPVAASAAALAAARAELAAARDADTATADALRADFDNHFAGGHDDRYLRLETGGTVLGAVALDGGATTPTLAVTAAFAPETVSASTAGTRGVTALSSATDSVLEDRAATPRAVSSLGAALRAEASAQFVDAAGDDVTGTLRFLGAGGAETAALDPLAGKLTAQTVEAGTYLGIPVASTASTVPGLTTLSNAIDGSAGVTVAATSRAVGDLGTALRAELVDAAGDDMTGTLRFLDAGGVESAAIDPLTGRVSARTVSAGTYLNLPIASTTTPGVVVLRNETDVDDPTTAASSRAVYALRQELDQAPGRYVDVAGDTMTGPLALGDVLLDPGTSSVTATRYYGLPYAQVSTVAANAGVVLLTDDPLAPGAARTDVAASLAATRALDASLRAWASATFVDAAGDAMTGDLTFGTGTLRPDGTASFQTLEVLGDPYTSWGNLPVATATEAGILRVSSSLTLSDDTVAASTAATRTLRLDLDRHDRAAILSTTDATEVRALEDRVRVRNVAEGVDLAVFDAVTRNFEVLHGGIVGQWAHLLAGEDFSVPGAFAGGVSRLSLMCEGDASAREVLLHSDARLKTAVVDLTPAEAWRTLAAARPRTYAWRDRSPDAARSAGFVAQELLASEETARLVKAVPDPGMEDGQRLVVSYNEMIAPMVAAMRDLAARVAELERRLAA